MVDTPMVSPSDETLLNDLHAEADLCRNEGADDIAKLLDRAIAALSAQPSEPVGWNRWHGSTASPPKDWNGAECMLGDGTWGIPRGCDWGPFNENMVAFYPVLTSPQPSLELLDIPQSERGHPLGKLWSEAFHAWEEKGHWAACEILARYIAAQPSEGEVIERCAQIADQCQEAGRSVTNEVANRIARRIRKMGVTTPSTPPEPQEIEFIGCNDDGFMGKKPENLTTSGERVNETAVSLHEGLADLADKLEDIAYDAFKEGVDGAVAHYRDQAPDMPVFEFGGKWEKAILSALKGQS